MSISFFFSGSSLSFRVTGEGVVIDPATGFVTVSDAALLAGVSVGVTAVNSAGETEASFRLATASLAAPATVGMPAPAVFAQGSGSRTVATQAFFSGAGLAYALDAPPAGVTINPVSGLVTVATAAVLEANVTVRATNVAGAATQRFSVRVLAAPVALAAPAPVVFAQGAGSKTIAAAAFFAGADLGFALDAAPAGVTINAGSGLVTVPTTAALAATLVVRATNLVGAATQSVAVSVRAGVALMTNTTPPTFKPRIAPGTTVGSVWDIGAGAWAGGVAPYSVERSVFRGATQTVPYGAAASYRILAADRTTVQNTITARVRRTDSSVPPQVVTVTASGSAVIPAIATGDDADFVVNNSTELQAAMIASAAMSGPRLILCNSGDYGPLTIQRSIRNELIKTGWNWLNYPGGQRGQRRYQLNDANRVTIRAQNRAARFLNATVNLENVWGYTFDGFTFESTQTRAGGFPALNALGITGMDLRNFTVTNCTFINLHEGVRLRQRAFASGPYGHNKFTVQPSGQIGDGTGFNLEVSNCEFRGISLNAIYTCSDVIVRQRFHNNYIHSWAADPALQGEGPPSSRPAGISSQGKWNEEWDVRRNFIVGPSVQMEFRGIHLRNRWSGKDYDFDNIISAHGPEIAIEDNTVIQRSAAGINVEATTGMVIRRNRVLPLAATALPGITLDPEINSTSITDNVLGRAIVSPNRSSFTQSGNTIDAAVVSPDAVTRLFRVGPA